MSNQVYIRPLQVEDALTSYRWRNNPKIWRFTGSRPDKYITPEMETAWITAALQRENEKRFAICLLENDEYIGNIFFTDIKNNECQVHIFIGEVKYWGKDRAFEGGWLGLEYMFENGGMEQMYMEMHKDNSGVSGAKRMGWKPTLAQENGFIKYVFTRQMFQQMRPLVEAQFKNGRRLVKD